MSFPFLVLQDHMFWYVRCKVEGELGHLGVAERLRLNIYIYIFNIYIYIYIYMYTFVYLLFGSILRSLESCIYSAWCLYHLRLLTLGQR